MATSKRSLPIVTPGQRPAYASHIERAVAKLADADPAKLRLRASTTSKVAVGIKLGWSIPAGPEYACPGATADCRSCYAQQGRFAFSAEVASLMVENWFRFRHLEATVSVAEAASELANSVVSNALAVFRIHVSGDFHSQWAVDVWADVVRRRPHIKFWTYTRSFKLDFSGLIALPNMRLYASTDSQNLREAQAFIRTHGKRVAHAFGPYTPGAKLPANSVECPPTLDKYRQELAPGTEEFGHEGACVECKKCIPYKSNPRPLNIVFYPHERSQATTGYSEEDLGAAPRAQPTASLAVTLHAPGLSYDGCSENDGDPIHFP